jgi:hypothetical protein
MLPFQRPLGGFRPPGVTCRGTGGTIARMDVQDPQPQQSSEPQDAVVEEWPPRAWRETTRSAGHKQALYVSLGMLAIFGVLVVVAIWASKNG